MLQTSHSTSKPVHTAFDDMANDDGFVASVQPAATTALYRENCRKCAGTGRYRGPSCHGSACFECKGLGFHEFKTSPEYRLQQRDKAAKRKQATSEAAVKAWADAHPAEAAWVAKHADRGEGFGYAMHVALQQWHNLTPGQLAAVQKCIAGDAQRDVERQERAVSAPACDVSKIEQAFSKAAATGLKRLQLRLAAFVFKPAKASSKNPGAIYVTEGEQYLGKVLGGKFHRVHPCTPEREAEIVRVASDPAAAAIAYGRTECRCSICGLELTDPVSKARGIGPICAGKYGF